MKKLQNMVLNELITENDIESIYRANNKNDNTKFLIKKLKPEYNTIHYTQRLQNELSIGKEINSKYIFKPIEILNEDSSLSLIAENVEGILLSKFIKTNKNNLEETLEIAIAICNALSDLHKKDNP
jgi:serine/threonine protein kinase